MHNPTSYFQNGSKIPAKFKLIELQQFVFYQTSTKKAAYHCVRAKQRQSGTEWVSSLRLQSKQIKQTNEILPGMILIWEIKISNLWERLTLQSDGNLQLHHCLVRELQCCWPQDPPADSEHSCKDHRCPSPIHPGHFSCTMLQQNQQHREGPHPPLPQSLPAPSSWPVQTTCSNTLSSMH